MKLLQSQKNQLFDIIEEYGLSPIQFEIYDARSLRSKIVNTKVTYKGTDFYFSFGTADKDKTSHTATYSPGTDSYEAKKYPNYWFSQIDTFKEWLTNLKRELNSIDKWKRLGEEFESLKISKEGDNEKFSFQEVKEIEGKIEILKGRLSKIGLLPQQLNTINEKLDTLTESAQQMNRFDWRSLFLGTIVSIIIQLNVTPENANLIWQSIKDVFNQYLLN